MAGGATEFGPHAPRRYRWSDDTQRNRRGAYAAGSPIWLHEGRPMLPLSHPDCLALDHAVSGNGQWVLPVPATYVFGRHGRVKSVPHALYSRPLPNEM